jgi:CBS domain-containing protein
MELNDPIELLLKHKGGHLCCISSLDSVYEAIAQMAREKVGALLVISGSQLVGIVSERDYARKVILQGRSSQTTQVSEIMSSPVIFVSPETTVGECMEIITEHRIRHLPVMKHNQLAGMVSIGDLVNCILEAQRDHIRHLESYIAGQAS